VGVVGGSKIKVSRQQWENDGPDVTEVRGSTFGKE